MANDIQLKRSSVSGRVPDAANVLVGEPVVNLADKIIFTKDGTGNVIVIGAGTTSNVVEGSNLYFSNARVYANVAPLLANISSGGATVYFQNTSPATPSTGSYWINSDTGKEYLYYDDGSSLQWVEQLTGVYTYNDPTGLNTDEVLEATSLYYTNARVYANVTQLGYITASSLGIYATNSQLNSYATTLEVDLKANVTDLTTANVAELNNLYYTNARVYANVTERLANLNTNVYPAISEVYSLGSPTNKFKDLYLSGNTIVLGTTTLSSSVDGLTVNSIRSNVWGGLYTANVLETSGNLYFSNSRVVSAISSQTLGNATFTGDVLITGNLSVTGNVTTFTANTIEIADTIIYLASNNSGDAQDIGLVGHFTNPGYQHTGLVRDASDGVWKLFANVQTEPSSNVLDFTTATYSTLKIGDLQASSATFTGNINASNLITTNKVTAQQWSGLYAANVSGLGTLATLNNLPVANVTGLGSLATASTVANTQITGVITSSQLANTAVTATTYGGTTAIPVIVVDQQGRIISASNVSVTASAAVETGFNPFLLSGM